MKPDRGMLMFVSRISAEEDTESGYAGSDMVWGVGFRVKGLGSRAAGLRGYGSEIVYQNAASPRVQGAWAVQGLLYAQ